MFLTSRQAALALAVVVGSASHVHALRGYDEAAEEVLLEALEEDLVVAAAGKQQRQLPETKYPPPTPAPTKSFPPSDDYYAGADDYYTPAEPTPHPTHKPTYTYQPTTTYFPTTSPYPTVTAYPTYYYYHTKSPHPTPEPTPYDKYYPTTKSPYPTAGEDDLCAGKPLDIKIDLEGTYLLFCTCESRRNCE